MLLTNILESERYIDESVYSSSELLFNSKKFNVFNSKNCDYIYVHFDSKLNMYFGIKNNCLLAPFSAPFSFPRFANTDIKYSHVLKFIKTLSDDFKKTTLSSIKITLPPSFYIPTVNSKLSLALEKTGFSLDYRDINSHFDIDGFNIDDLNSSAKKTIRKSNSFNNNFFRAESEDEKKLAYEIIKKNREEKGYPLRMSWEQVSSTTNSVANADFFIATIDGIASASAMVFRLNESIAQVVYWGGTADGENKKIMYFLPFEIINYYKSLNYKFLDIGTSSEEGVINNGLNDYKQMIGCINSVKETWTLKND